MLDIDSSRSGVATIESNRNVQCSGQDSCLSKKDDRGSIPCIDKLIFKIPLSPSPTFQGNQTFLFRISNIGNHLPRGNSHKLYKCAFIKTYLLV